MGRGQLQGQLWDQLGDQLRDQLRDQFGYQLGGQLQGQLGGQLWGQLRYQLGGQLRDQLRGQLGGLRPWECVWDYYLMAFYECACHRLCTPTEYMLQGSLLPAFRAGLGHLIQMGGLVVGVPLPEAHRDDRMRLHCETGPAIRWQDGSQSWWLAGTQVPRHVVEEPATISVDQIRAEQNVEVRRIMRERFGEGRYLRETGAKVIDVDTRQVSCADDRGVPRALLEDSEGERWLVGTDHSTARVYYMRAPRDAATCRAAHEALCGYAEDRIVSQS